MSTSEKTPYEESFEQTVEDLSDEIRTRVDEVTDQARQDLIDVQEQMRELREDMTVRAVALKTRVVEELQQAAQRIREETADLEDDTVVQRADAVAADLEKTADYLEERSLDDLGQEVTQVAQQSVWQVVGIAFFVGLILGLLVAWGNRR